MRRRAARAALAAGALACGLVGSAQAATPAPTFRPPHLKPDMSTAEGGIWGMSDKAEAYVRTSAELDTDPALTAYVKEIVCRLAETYCDELRVYVLDRPVFNAAAAPNGYIEVNSGLLLRAQNEDELAYVLGHEISHFALNHSMQHYQQMKSTANAMLVLQLGVTAGAAAAMYSTASTGAPNAGQTINSISQSAQALNNLIYLAGVASIFAYSRDQESEADSEGFALFSKAGYTPGAAPKIWDAVVGETAASDFPRVRKSEARASIFNTHPVTADRIAALTTLAGAAPATKPGAAVDGHRYRAMIRPHLAAWLRDDLRRRDFGQTLYILDRLQKANEDLGVIAFFRGEVFRLRRGDGDAAAAVAAYQEAVRHDDAPLEAYRELGDALRKAGDKTAALSAYESYLAKAPDADDRWIVEGSVKSLRPQGAPS